MIKSKKEIKVSWVEYHSQIITADPDSDDLLNECEIDETNPTLETIEMQESKVIGEAYADEDGRDER